jgi:hypothetical protein
MAPSLVVGLTGAKIAIIFYSPNPREGIFFTIFAPLFENQK